MKDINMSYNKVSIKYLTNKVIQYKASKDWYYNSNKLIKELYSDNYKTFIYLLGITSPRNTVKTNTIFTIRAYNEVIHNTHNDIKYGISHKNIYSNIQRVKEGKYNKVTGAKVKSFINSLLLIPGSICLDVWMKRVFNINTHRIKETDRIQIYNKINTIASNLNMESYEVQACLWSYAKKELSTYRHKEIHDFSYYLKQIRP